MTAADEYIVDFDSITFENGDLPSTLDGVAGVSKKIITMKLQELWQHKY